MADALRLIAASAVLVPAVLLSAFADARVRRTELAMLESVVTLPATLRDLLTAIAQLVLVLVPLAILVGAVVRRRFALLGRFVVTTVIATAASVLLSQLLRTSHPEEWHGLLSGRGGVFGVTVPPAAWLSGATALLTVANPELPRRWRTALWWTIGTAAVLGCSPFGSSSRWDRYVSRWPRRAATYDLPPKPKPRQRQVL